MLLSFSDKMNFHVIVPFTITACDVFSCFSPWMAKCQLHPGFPILDSIPRWVWSCKKGPKARGRLDFSRFKGASTLLLSGSTDASKILHQWYFSLQTQKRRRRSRIFLIVEGNWDLYLCSHKNLSGIVWIPAALSDAGKAAMFTWLESSSAKGILGGYFWKSGWMLIRKWKKSHVAASAPEIVV